MNNLYMSARLCRLTYMSDQRVMVHGVTRPSLRGIPPAIKQKEIKKKTELKKVRKTVKAAVLKGDEVISNLINVSIHDTKPVYLLTSVTEGIKWVKKEKKFLTSQRTKLLKCHSTG